MEKVEEKEDEKGAEAQGYEDEPVYYCRRCLSLNIRISPGLGDYCASCGGASVGVTDMAGHGRMMAERIRRLKEKGGFES